MTDQLKLAIGTTLEADPAGAKYLQLDIKPVMNGVPIVSNVAFNVRRFLAQGLVNGPFSILTCACGDEGCLEDAIPTTLTSDHEVVSWNFDKVLFTTLLPETLADRPELSFSFDRNQYTEMLEHTATTLALIEKIGGMPLHYDALPLSGVEEIAKPVLSRIEEDRRNLMGYLRGLQARERRL